MPHYCHAKQCTVPVPPRMFMCRKHWFMLPKQTRDAVWEHYVPGQEEGLFMPTDEYIAVTSKAIAWLAVEEGLDARA